MTRAMKNITTKTTHNSVLFIEIMPGALVYYTESIVLLVA